MTAPVYRGWVFDAEVGWADWHGSPLVPDFEPGVKAPRFDKLTRRTVVGRGWVHPSPYTITS